MSWFEEWFNTPYYHMLYQNRNEQEAKAFVEELIKDLKLPKGSRVLDVACGKGRHSLTFNSKGYEVLGIDISPANIIEASEKASKSLKFLEQDMREPLPMEYHHHFDCAVNLFTSFGYFETDEEHERAIQSISDAIKPEGLLVIDYLNAEKTIKGLVREEIKSVDGNFFFIKRKFDGKRIVKTISFEDQRQGKNFEFEEKVMAFTFADFERLLVLAGMKVKKVYGDYKLHTFNPDKSDRMIIIAKKAI